MKLTYALIIAVLIAAFATPVSADAPEFFSYPEEGEMQFDCGTYTVMYEWEGIVRLTTHWDQGFINIHKELSDAFYRTDNKGERYTHVERNDAKYNLITNEENVYGIWMHMVIPGSGSVYILAGHAFADSEGLVYWRGNLNQNNVDPDSICEAFAEN